MQTICRRCCWTRNNRLLAAILTSDHNDTDSSSSAQLNGAGDLFTGGIQHAHAANKGQVSLWTHTQI